jgi:hypothetical protein
MEFVVKLDQISTYVSIAIARFRNCVYAVGSQGPVPIERRNTGLEAAGAVPMFQSNWTLCLARATVHRPKES